METEENRIRGGNEDPTIVIDPGSAYFKAGMTGGFVPKVVFDSAMGKPKTPGVFSTAVNGFKVN